MSDQPRIAYCAPGRTEQARQLLAGRGERYDLIEETAIMEGSFSVILVDQMIHDPQLPLQFELSPLEDPCHYRWIRDYLLGTAVIRPDLPFGGLI